MIAVVALVCTCPVSVEGYAAAGRQVPRASGAVCPCCKGRLRADGGYSRQVRSGGRRHQVWVRRGRCPSCGRSWALLPEFLLAHYLDTVETIGAAVCGRKTPGVPASTIAGWRRRWRANEADLLAGTAAAHVAFAGTVTTAETAGSLQAMVVALWLAAQRRGRTSATPWRSLNVITGMSWMATRVNSSWEGVGMVPVAARAP